MKKQNIVNLLVLIGTFTFNFLFWQEKMGLNVLLFTLLLLGGIFFLYPSRIRGKLKNNFSKATLATLGGTLLMALLVLLHNSLMSKIMFSISFTAMVGMIHQREIKFFFYGISQGLINIGYAPKNLLQQFPVQGIFNHPNAFRRNWNYARISIVPLLVLALFYSLYYAANPKFASLSNSTWEWVFHLFDWNISFPRILLFLFGFFIVGGALWKSENNVFAKLNALHSEQLVRNKRDRNHPFHLSNILALKNEYRTGLLMMGMLNILLLVVNLIDIRYVWFNFQEQPPFSLKNYVHEGTYLLIASILLAMSIIIFYFRGNLNFYKKNKTLQQLTYIWITQNVILTFSVFMRNFKYIDYHGLAYKRIGVMIFLIAVIFGLFTMYQKVKERRSFYFLLNRNMWGVYILLTLATLINWDTFITRYNITVETKRPVDVSFLMNDISDKNLFLLYEFEEELFQKAEVQYSDEKIKSMRDRKLKSFEKRQAWYSWLSWNYSDYRNRKLLN